MRTHPQAGYQIVKNAGLCETVQHIVLFTIAGITEKVAIPTAPLSIHPYAYPNRHRQRRS